MSIQTQTKPATFHRPAAGHDYRTLLTHVEPGLRSTRRVELAAGLARRFQARLIGVGAEILEAPITFAPDAGRLIADLYEQLQRQLETDLGSAEAAFLRDAAGGDIEWRSSKTLPIRAMAEAARAADLIVATNDQGALGGAIDHAGVAELVLTCSRPVLVAPPADGHLAAENIIVAWKDTPEARRAVADALPFLVRAQKVRVLAVCRPGGETAAQRAVDDVAAALRRHGAPADSRVAATDESAAGLILAEATALDADLVVAGAFGRSRMMEWALGGVTQDLLAAADPYLLLSH